MGALYDLFKTPAAYGEEEGKGLLHARIVNGTKVTGNALLTEIADASSFTMGDLKGMVSEVTGAMARHLAMAFIDKQVFMSRMDYQRITGCNKSMAQRNLDFWVEASILCRYGSGKVIVYYCKDMTL